jgi:hypothetical protein
MKDRKEGRKKERKKDDLKGWAVPECEPYYSALRCEARHCRHVCRLRYCRHVCRLRDFTFQKALPLRQLHRLNHVPGSICGPSKGRDHPSAPASRVRLCEVSLHRSNTAESQ